MCFPSKLAFFDKMSLFSMISMLCGSYVPILSTSDVMIPFLPFVPKFFGYGH